MFLQLHGTFFKYQSNTYKEQFLPMTTDVCPIIFGTGNGAFDGLSKSFFVAMSKPFRNVLYAKGNSFPKSCPINPVSLYLYIHDI